MHVGLWFLLPASVIAQSQNRAFKETHSLRARWELEDSLRNGNFLLTPYKPVYVLPAVWSSAPNHDPRRTNGPDPSGNEQLPLDVIECKFQFSFKTKVVQGLYKDKGDIWVGLYAEFPLAGVQLRVQSFVPRNQLRTGGNAGVARAVPHIRFQRQVAQCGLEPPEQRRSGTIQPKLEPPDRADRPGTRPLCGAAAPLVALPRERTLR
ncbi:MAG: phospholipase A [Flavobacteriales bacterium]|nr:phospholipase A [Flavobacteriales bacterium]